MYFRVSIGYANDTIQLIPLQANKRIYLVNQNITNPPIADFSITVFCEYRETINAT